MVGVYQHPVNNTYRIVGRKENDNTVWSEVETSLLVVVCKKCVRSLNATVGNGVPLFGNISQSFPQFLTKGGLRLSK